MLIADNVSEIYDRLERVNGKTPEGTNIIGNNIGKCLQCMYKGLNLKYDLRLKELLGVLGVHLSAPNLTNLTR